MWDFLGTVPIWATQMVWGGWTLWIFLPSHFFEFFSTLAYLEVDHWLFWLTFQITWQNMELVPFNLYSKVCQATICWKMVVSIFKWRESIYFTEAHKKWNQPDKFFIWLFIFFQFNLSSYFNIESLKSWATVIHKWSTNAWQL